MKKKEDEKSKPALKLSNVLKHLLDFHFSAGLMGPICEKLKLPGNKNDFSFRRL